jgi:hypothetical protein
MLKDINDQAQKLEDLTDLHANCTDVIWDRNDEIKATDKARTTATNSLKQ